MKKLLFFVSTFLSSLSLANHTSFEIHWYASENSSATAIQRAPGEIFLYMNENSIPFYTLPGTIRYKRDGYVLQSISSGQVPGSTLRVGVNNVRYTFALVGTDFLKSGTFESILFQNLRGQRSQICHTFMAAGQRAVGSCQSQFQMTLDELDPLLAQQLRDLAKQLAEMQKFSKVDEFQERFKLAESLLKDLESKEFSQLVDSDYAAFTRAHETILNLRKDIGLLQLEIANTQAIIKENLQTKHAIILDELKKEGLESLEAPVLELQFNFHETPTAPNCDASEFNHDDSIYRNYANSVLDKLQAGLASNDRLGFLTEVKAWTNNVATYEKIALGRKYFSKQEWQAYQQQYDRVLHFIDKHVDKDLWFKDSPVPVEVRQSLKEEMHEIAPVESSDLESALKKLSAKELTPEQRRSIETVQALALLAKELVKSAKSAIDAISEFQEQVRQTTKVIASGISCVVQAQLSSRVGSFYELVTGKSQCDGSDLSVAERIISGVELALGSPKLLTALGTVVGVGEFAKKAKKLGERVHGSIKDIRGKMSNLGELIPGTTIPKYFRLKIENAEFFVNPNATKHMGEYINSRPMSHGFPLRNDAILASFESSVTEAVKSGAWKTSLDTGNPIVSNGWELIFAKRPTDELVVIKHALMKK